MFPPCAQLKVSNIGMTVDSQLTPLIHVMIHTTASTFFTQSSSVGHLATMLPVNTPGYFSCGLEQLGLDFNELYKSTIERGHSFTSPEYNTASYKKSFIVRSLYNFI